MDSKELQDWGEHSGAGRMGVALISYRVPARPAAPWDTPRTEMSPAWVGHIGLVCECIWRESSDSCQAEEFGLLSEDCHSCPGEKRCRAELSHRAGGEEVDPRYRGRGASLVVQWLRIHLAI